jgi:hypothetical protein
MPVFVVNNSRGFVGVFTTEAELIKNVTNVYITQSFIITSHVCDQAEQYYCVPLRDFDIVIYLSHDKEQAQRYASLMFEHGFIDENDISYHVAQANVIPEIIKKQLDAIEDAHQSNEIDPRDVSIFDAMIPVYLSQQDEQKRSYQLPEYFKEQSEQQDEPIIKVASLSLDPEPVIYSVPSGGC